MSNQVVIECPSCSQKYRVAASYVGHRARCARCKFLFVVGAGDQLDEDTILSWISETEPASDSVMGSSGLFHPSDPPACGSGSVLPPAGGTPAEPAVSHNRWTGGSPDEKGPRVHLARIDEAGAHFEFGVLQLAKDAFRDSLPRKCAGCGTRHGLRVHLLCWPDRMAPAEAARWQDLQNTALGEIEQFKPSDGPAWLAALLPPWQAPPPFDKPLALFLCRHCRAAHAVQGSVTTRDATESCVISFKSLSIAVDFYRNNGGHDTPEYRKLVEERDVRHDRINELSPEVRARLSHWFTPLPGERFLHFYPDAEFSPAEAGLAGAVLTVRRLVLKRFAAYRDYPFSQPCRLDFRFQGARCTIAITEQGHRAGALVLSQADAEQLRHELKKLHPKWSYGN